MGNGTIPWKTLLGDLARGEETRILFGFVCLNVVILMFEILYGLSTGSLGLVCDGVHMAVSCSGLAISLIAIKLGQQLPTLQFSYGFDRLEVLAAFTNAVFLIFVSLFIVAEAVHRFSEPVNMHSDHIFVVASVGLVVNVAGYVLLTRLNMRGLNFVVRSSAGYVRTPTSSGSSRAVARDANLQSVLLHTKGDIVSSLGVMLSNILVRWKGWLAADPLVALVIASLVVYSVSRLLVSMALILLQTTPANNKVAIDKGIRDISALEGVIECLRERYWVHTPGVNVATLRIKIRPDADRHQVLVGAHQILAPLVSHCSLQLERAQPIGWWNGQEK